MIDQTTTAEIIQLRKAPMTGAQRAKAYRERKKAASNRPAKINTPVTVPAPVTVKAMPVTLAAVTTPVTRVTKIVTPSHKSIAPWLLTGAAILLAMVGITMNGWFARSLGSSEIAGWLFLAIGVAADAAALALPSGAAALWQARQRVTALTAWAIWLATFAFAVTAGIGFASVNISDVTLSRASRVTPAVTAAQTALSDAMASRDRECKGGVGKFCREREAAVASARQTLEAAMATVEQAADPQTQAASRIVAWVSRGWLAPSGDDFAMLRLVLLALLPQVGGILMMIGRAKV